MHFENPFYAHLINGTTMPDRKRLLKAGAEMPMPQREAEKHRRLAATMGYEFYEMGFCTPMEEGGHRHML